MFAASVNSKYDSGDYAGAAIASQNAGKWTKIGFWVGLAIAVLYFILMFVVGISFMPHIHQ